MYICSTATRRVANTHSSPMAFQDIDIVHPQIEQYLNDSIPERDDVLSDMEAYAKKNNFPIIGPLVGRMLFVLASSIKAKNILELGSGFGYSAYWFAQATADDARIICTDGREGNARRAAQYLGRAALAHKMDFRVGNALEIMATLSGEFDIIFNDIDKHDYPRALTLSLPKLRKGGLFITDNALWKGRVLGEKPDGATAGVLTLNRMLYASPQLFTTIIPIRDGVSVSIKL
jgi:caffeoyl-CoA O-methyltransferase